MERWCFDRIGEARPVQTYLESTDSEWFNQRLSGLMVLVLVGFAVLIARLLYLQVVEGDEYRRLSEINSIRLQDIDAPRGLIFDRNNQMLVDNRPSFDLHIILKDAKPLDVTLAKLGRIMGEPPEALRERIRNTKRRGPYTPLLLKEDIGRDLLAAIEVHKYDLPGVVVHVTPRRHYLFGTFAAHLLGYVGEISAEELRCPGFEVCKGGDYIGKFGIEKSFESLLRGKRGGRQVEVNATGQVVRVLETVDAQAGHNLSLTIDHQVQAEAEALLQGKAGAVVALDPNNGEILAMASNPTFDPNWFVVGMRQEQWQALITNPYRPLENKAIQAEYPPASTYKIITAIAGLEEGAIDAGTTMFCPGYYRYGNRIYRCWKHAGHGPVNVVRALEQSCDVFFYQVGEAVGVDTLAKYAKAFGLGDLTGIGLAQEAKGLVPTKDWKLRRLGEPWQGGETLSVAIGQGFDLVTPLQMAVLAATVGNGGTRFRPRLVRNCDPVPEDGSLAIQAEIAGHVDISEATLSLVRQGLWNAVNKRTGTAWASRLKEMEFSGKTGTAQVVGRPPAGIEDEEQIKEMHKDHAWFVAYAPSVRPRIAVAVIVEHGEHGSSAAAPIASKVIETYLGGSDDVAGLEMAPGAPVENAGQTGIDGGDGE
jgi:penicillin-binding protein 2